MIVSAPLDLAVSGPGHILCYEAWLGGASRSGVGEGGSRDDSVVDVTRQAIAHDNAEVTVELEHLKSKRDWRGRQRLGQEGRQAMRW